MRKDPEFVPPLWYDIQLYSNELIKDAIVLIKPLASGTPPKIFAFNRFNDINLSGLCLSYAKVTIKQMETGSYMCTVHYDATDVGKIMYLYVYFEVDCY